MPLSNSVSSFAAAAPGPQEPKQVTFFFDANTRVKNLAGEDVYAQIMYMALDGLSNVAIAQALGVSIDVVADHIQLRQFQICAAMGNGWEPRRRNPRKTKIRGLAAKFPTEKKIF